MTMSYVDPCNDPLYKIHWQGSAKDLTSTVSKLKQDSVATVGEDGKERLAGTYACWVDDRPEIYDPLTRGVRTASGEGEGLSSGIPNVKKSETECRVYVFSDWIDSPSRLRDRQIVAQ